MANAAPMTTLSLLVATMGVVSGLSVSTSLSHRLVVPRNALRMTAGGPDPDLDAPDEKDDLAAAFQARLAQEGGATQFKIKSELKNVASGLQACTACTCHHRT